MEKLFEGSYAHSIAKAYDDLFMKRSSMRVPEEIPPSLSYLFYLMVVCNNTDHSLLSNGAGKVFLAELLRLSALFGVAWFPKLSTTNSPLSDWCGIPHLVGDPHHVFGVADLMLVTLEGEQLLLAEVKSEARAPRGTGEFQLLAELRTLQRTRPVFWTAGKPGVLVAVSTTTTTT